MSFCAVEPTPIDLFDGIAAGRIRIPDFQRGWVWDDNNHTVKIFGVALTP